MRKSQKNSSLSLVKHFIDPKFPFSFMICIIIVGCSLVASVALGFGLVVHAHSTAHAAPALVSTQVPAINSQYGVDPWDVKFDKNGHVFVAEPQCDVDVNIFPVCGSSIINTGIIEYSVANFTNNANPINKLLEPQGYTSPFFLAFDSSGNLWFTEPVSNSIGEYDTQGNWHQWSVPTAQASPFDLTFDQYGHLWFTEIHASQVGEFDPGTQTFNEYPTPTPDSRPYGITGPDPTAHSIWFTENSGTVHRIVELTPNTDGTIKGGQMKEYLTTTNCPGSNCITPHLITYDQTGAIWWSEGYDGSIGELVISQAVNGTSNGVIERAVPPPNCPPDAQNCSSHISGIGVDSNGLVWFDDALSSRYGSYNPSTNQFSMYVVGSTTSNDHPHDGLTVDCNNNVWFSEEFANTLTEVQSGTSNNQSCGSPQPSPTVSPTSNPSPSPTPTLQPGPVNKTWYFAEGRAGGHFNEYLSMDNPTSNPARSLSNTSTRPMAVARR